MLTFTRGKGLSMKSPEEFTEEQTEEPMMNEFIELSDSIDELLEMLKRKETNDSEKITYKDSYKDSYKITYKITYKIPVKDELLFRKTEQIINSYDSTKIIIKDNFLCFICEGFKNKPKESTIRFPNYISLYWFIMTSLKKIVYELSLKIYEKSNNDIVAFNYLGFIPKDIVKKLKNMNKNV